MCCCMCCDPGIVLIATSLACRCMFDTVSSSCSQSETTVRLLFFEQGRCKRKWNIKWQSQGRMFFSLAAKNMHPEKVLSTMSLCLWIFVTETPFYRWMRCFVCNCWNSSHTPCYHYHEDYCPKAGIPPVGFPLWGCSLRQKGQISKALIQQRQETPGHQLMFTTTPCRLNSLKSFINHVHLKFSLQNFQLSKFVCLKLQILSNAKVLAFCKKHSRVVVWVCCASSFRLWKCLTFNHHGVCALFY